MKIGETVYAAFGHDGEIIHTAEAIMIMEDKEVLNFELKAWRRIPKSEATIKKVKIVEAG